MTVASIQEVWVGLLEQQPCRQAALTEEATTTEIEAKVRTTSSSAFERAVRGALAVVTSFILLYDEPATN